MTRSRKNKTKCKLFGISLSELRESTRNAKWHFFIWHRSALISANNHFCIDEHVIKFIQLERFTCYQCKSCILYVHVWFEQFVCCCCFGLISFFFVRFIFSLCIDFSLVLVLWICGFAVIVCKFIGRIGTLNEINTNLLTDLMWNCLCRMHLDMRPN